MKTSFLVAFGGGTFLAIWGACAETQEYQVRRLVYLNTSCGTETFKKLPTSDGLERFLIGCKNVSAYPEGLEVVCSDPEDDRSCKVVTDVKSFENLELLRPFGEAQPPPN